LKIPAPLERIIGGLSRLPGIGEKSATRFAFFILGESQSYARDLASGLSELHETIRHCEFCHGLAESEICSICRDSTRDDTRLCIVEGIPELMAIERSGEFRGRYHVLHGVLSPLKGVGPNELKIDSLVERIENGNVTEIILATNVDVEGEATAVYLQRLLARFEGMQVSRIATGVPMGGDLEYLDQVTVARAIRDRRPF
jgi:recombination protein RecR